MSRDSWLVRVVLPLLALAAVPFVISQSWVLNLAVLGVMYAALASSWNLLAGYTGYISLAHAAFFGIGAYALARVAGATASLAGYGPFLLAVPIGLVVGLAAIPVGWVILRTRHVTFASVTITVLFIVQTLAFNLTGLTGGSQGLAVAAPPFQAAGFEQPFYWAMTALLALAVVIFEAVRRSRLGLSLTALREDEEKARGLGVPTQPLKIGAFAVSVAITAMIGGVWAYYITYVMQQYAIDPLMMVGIALTASSARHLWGPRSGRHRGPGAATRLPRRRQRPVPGVYAAIFLIVILLLPRGATLGERLPAAAAAPLAPEEPADEPGRAPTPACRPRPAPQLRRRAGRPRLRHRRPAAHDHWPDRAERIGQDHRVQHHHRLPRRARRRGGVRRRPPPQTGPAPPLPGGPVPHLPAGTGVPRAERAGEPGGSDAPARASTVRPPRDRRRPGAGDAHAREFGLAGHAAARAGQLSYGQRKLLEFAAALMGEPKLILLDEPTAGVNPVMIATMERHIRERHAGGVTFLIVEHDMNFVMRLCDPVIVLDRGTPIAGCPADPSDSAYWPPTPGD
jgi:branched-chain amino acid transport system permease protein